MTAGGEAALLTFEKEQKVMKKLKKLQKKATGADASGELCTKSALSSCTTYTCRNMQPTAAVCRGHA